LKGRYEHREMALRPVEGIPSGEYRLMIYEAQRAVLLAKKLRLEGRGIVLQCDKNMGSPFSCQFPVAIPELPWTD
jgi:hypothetical protein